MIHDEHWDKFGPAAVGIGWDLALVGLTTHLATGEAVDRSEAHAWMASENYKECITQSGKAWLTAHIASGVDANLATEQADRTIAFYRGETSPGVSHPGTGC